MHGGPQCTQETNIPLARCVFVFVCSAHLTISPYLGCPLAGLGSVLRPNGLQDMSAGTNKSGVQYQQSPGYPIHTDTHNQVPLLITFLLLAC